MGNVNWQNMLVQIGIAIIILLVTWIVARIVRAAVAKLVQRIPALQRSTADGNELGGTIGRIASLLVWLFGLIAILQVFQLTQVLTPVQNLLNTIMGYLPNLIGAGLVLFVGYLLAKIVRDLVRTTLDAAGVEQRLRGLFQRGSRSASGTGTSPGAEASAPGAPAAGSPTAGGAATSGATGDPGDTRPQPTGGSTTSGPSITSVIANLLFVVILVVVAIAALQILGIPAIADPASQMLNTALDVIPVLLGAAVVLFIGYLVARLVGPLLESTLQGLGLDRAVGEMDVLPEGRSASSILTTLVKIGIMVFFAVMAAQMLNFPAVTNMLNEVLALGGDILFGAVIILAGVGIGTMLTRVVGTGTTGQFLKIATIVLFAAMGLQFMGIANSIINLAFGALVVGGALAAALAFGLGGRDAAARTLEDVRSKAKRKDAESETPGL